MSKVNLYKIEEIIEALTEFKKTKNLMTVNEALVFLTAAKFSEPCIHEIAKMSGVTRMTTSRLIFSLSSGDRRRKGEGLGLLERYEDPVNRLQTRVKLTEKGRKLFEKIGGK